jgi:hypothetical protein
MFGFFKKKKSLNNKTPKLMDLNNQPLFEGDMVMSLRYEMGKCIVRQTETGIEYESVKTGEIVSWVKMIDAATDNQKVRKILPGEDENGNSSEEKSSA